MGLFSAFRPRVSGDPPSANGASSFHLGWAGAPHALEVAAVLEVVVPPVVDRLYFWALQVSFADGPRRLGAGHIGLQWHPAHPGSTAVNWGGYEAGGSELSGSVSELPSATANPNTRDFAWLPGRPYRLAVRRVGQGWRGTVTDLADGTTTVLRDLYCGGDRLVDPVVWSEVFARCDDPSVTVRWSGVEATDAGGTARCAVLRTNYQTRADGGCDNTASRPERDGILQVTNTDRDVPQGTLLRLI